MIRPSITIRPEQPGDFDAIDEIVSAAFLAEFGTTTEAALVRTMRARGQLIPELTMVAEEHGVVVGHIAFSEVTLDGHGNGPIAAFCDALASHDVAVRVHDYHEHALSSGGDAKAASYLECAVNGRVLWGVGIDSSIVTSSLKAVVSALNRADRDAAST